MQQLRRGFAEPERTTTLQGAGQLPNSRKTIGRIDPARNPSRQVDQGMVEEAQAGELGLDVLPGPTPDQRYLGNDTPGSERGGQRGGERQAVA